MTSKKQKLELTWIGKEHRPRLEPRILLEEPERSYHAAHRVTEGDLFDNKLIHGDNLRALKVGLEREIKEMDRLIREARRNAVTAIALEEKLASQKQIKAIESQRNDKRRSLFEAQDAIDKQREDLIGKIEGKLQQMAAHDDLVHPPLAVAVTIFDQNTPKIIKKHRR